MILFLTGLGAKPAADAAAGINGHGPPVFGVVVVFRCVSGNQDLLGDGLGCLRYRSGQHAGHRCGNLAEHAAPGNIIVHGTSDGLCGTWHSVHLDPV